MAAWTYDLLVADLRVMMDRQENDTDFTAALPSIFEDAERRIVRECPLSVFHVDEAGTMVAGTQTIPRPSDVIATEYLRYEAGGQYRQLRLRPAAWLDEAFPTPTATGQPRYIALLSKTAYKIAPAPDSGYTYTLGYRRHLAFLDAGTATNVLTEQYPDLLRAALYARAALFSREDNPENAAEMGKHEANYQAVKQAVFGNEMLAADTTYESGSVERRTAR
jgi:hypothetical protein